MITINNIALSGYSYYLRMVTINNLAPTKNKIFIYTEVDKGEECRTTILRPNHISNSLSNMVCLSLNRKVL